MKQINPIPFIVVGAGHLGNFHLDKLSKEPLADLIGVVDVDPQKAQQSAQKFNIRAAESILSFTEHAQAAIISSPTKTHKDLSIQAINANMDVLIEKPLASTSFDAQKIIECAIKKKRLIQTGHVERFNPALQSALSNKSTVRYITSERLGPFSGRSTDIDVVLDLLIHDLDLVNYLVKSPLKEVRAIGMNIITEEIDMCSARLEFENGVVAELKAGRASIEPKRKMRLFTDDKYISIDCNSRTVKTLQRKIDINSKWPQIISKVMKIDSGDALQLQIQSFIQCILSRNKPKVDGNDGLKALQLAEAIKKQIKNK